MFEPAAVAGAPASGGPRELRMLWWLIAALVAIALATAGLRLHANFVLAAIAGGMVLFAWQRSLLAWPTLLGYVIVVILFIPIRRYTVLAGLPMTLEPYRVLIAIVLLAWLLALLADPSTRARRLNLEAPVIGFAVALLLSLAFNVGRIASTGLTSDVIKQISFFASFLLVMYFVGSVMTRRRQIDGVIMLMVAGGTLIALCSIVEWRTGYNAFNSLQRLIPVLHLDPAAASDELERGFHARAYASAQHPIALGAALVLLLPLAVYLYHRHRQLAWMACGAVLTLGALATGSRTVALMLAVELIVFLWLKREETIRLLPMLLPLILACQIVMPGTLGTFRAILFPEKGLIAEQEGGGTTGSGRVADLGPSLQEFERSPLFGQGFGTRLTSETDAVVNAKILDDEWLGTLLEVGAIGALCLLWMYVRAVRMLGRAAKPDASARGWLLAALAAAITAFAAGMLTYDAFSFIQVTFLSFMLLGIAAAALRLPPGEPTALIR